MALITEKRLSVVSRQVKALVKQQGQICVGINKARSLKRYPAESVIHFSFLSLKSFFCTAPVSFWEFLYGGGKGGFEFVRVSARVVCAFFSRRLSPDYNGL